MFHIYGLIIQYSFRSGKCFLSQSYSLYKILEHNTIDFSTKIVYPHCVCVCTKCTHGSKICIHEQVLTQIFICSEYVQKKELIRSKDDRESK